MAAEHFKCFRNSIVDGDYHLNELSLGVPWAVMQHFSGLKSGGGELTDGVGLWKVLTTALGKVVVVEHHLQKLPHNMHRSITGLYVLTAVPKGLLEGQIFSLAINE